MGHINEHIFSSASVKGPGRNWWHIQIRNFKRLRLRNYLHSCRQGVGKLLGWCSTPRLETVGWSYLSQAWGTWGGSGSQNPEADLCGVVTLHGGHGQAEATPQGGSGGRYTPSEWIYPEAVETKAWKPLTHIGPWVLIAARTCKVFCTGKQNQLAIRSISLQALLITCLKRPHTKKSAASKAPGVCSDSFCHSKEIVTFISNCVFVILYFS